MTAYYNENDPFAAQWLRNLIAAGEIAPGHVDDRSIVDVRPDDLLGYTQCHFFAGIGGWAYAARLAGWPDDRPLWTASCPCQPFSVAGKGEGQRDDRHLWPVFFSLVSARWPQVVMGEQVAAAVGKDWLDGVSADLEDIGYACGAAVIPACAVNAPHRRDRLWFVADSIGQRRQRRQRSENWHVANWTDAGREQGDGGASCLQQDDRRRSGDLANPDNSRPSRSGREPQSEGEIVKLGRNRPEEGHWGNSRWTVGPDGKARRIEPGLRLLAHGVPARVGKLRAYGNAIVPQVGATVIASYLDMEKAA